LRTVTKLWVSRTVESVVGYRFGGPGFESGQRQDIFVFSEAFRPALGLP